MDPLLEKWMESFGKWPPVNQLVFSAVLLIAALVLTAIAVYVLYLAFYHATVVVRGWPDESGRPTWADMAYLQRQMEAYRAWEKQQHKLTALQPSTTPSSPRSRTPEYADVPQPTRSVSSPGS